MIKFILYTNHCTNQNKVRKMVPTTVPTTFNKWQNSKEKSQAHNLKVVGPHPTPATNFLHKINHFNAPQELWFLEFFVKSLTLVKIKMPIN